MRARYITFPIKFVMFRYHAISDTSSQHKAHPQHLQCPEPQPHKKSLFWFQLIVHFSYSFLYHSILSSNHLHNAFLHSFLIFLFASAPQPLSGLTVMSSDTNPHVSLITFILDTALSKMTTGFLELCERSLPHIHIYYETVHLKYITTWNLIYRTTQTSGLNYYFVN